MGAHAPIPPFASKRQVLYPAGSPDRIRHSRLPGFDDFQDGFGDVGSSDYSAMATATNDVDPRLIPFDPSPRELAAIETFDMVYPQIDLYDDASLYHLLAQCDNY